MDLQQQKLRFSRQANMVKDPSGLSLLIIGVGGIGSNAAHLAASTGFTRITAVDPDEINEENVAPAFFNEMDVGRLKIDALTDDLYERFGVNVVGVPATLEQSDLLKGESFDIALICTDTLESRQEAWQFFAKILCHGMWIDARMGGVLSTVYAVEMGDEDAVADYTSELMNGEPGELPCGMKATAPLTKGWIPGMIGTVLVNAANGDKPPYMQRYDMGVGLFLKQDSAPARSESDG